MAKALVSQSSRDSQPFQLWADLQTRRLRAIHPISEALSDLKELEDKRKHGIIPLCDCHEEPPRA